MITPYSASSHKSTIKEWTKTGNVAVYSATLLKVWILITSEDILMPHRKAKCENNVLLIENFLLIIVWNVCICSIFSKTFVTQLVKLGDTPIECSSSNSVCTGDKVKAPVRSHSWFQFGTLIQERWLRTGSRMEKCYQSIRGLESFQSQDWSSIIVRHKYIRDMRGSKELI